jgi:hypothetical protein
MHRALLRHVMIGQSCVQGGRHLLPFHAEEESWKPAVEDSPASLAWGGRGSNPRPTDYQIKGLNGHCSYRYLPVPQRI